MEKFQVARALRDVARYLEIGEENKFRILAFQKAASAIEAFSGNLDDAVAKNRIQQIEGVGKAIGPMIEELVRTGSLGYLEELRRQYPPGIFELNEIPGLGLKKIGILWEQLGISSLEELEAAARGHRLAKLPGFGAKTEEKVLEGIAFVRTHAGRFRLETVLDLAGSLAERLREIAGVESVEIAGSVRRRLEVIRNLNLVATSRTPAATAQSIAASGILSSPEVEKGSKANPTSAVTGRAGEDLVVDVAVCTPAEFATTFFFRTGSRDFCDAAAAAAADQGLKLSASSLQSGSTKRKVATEEDIFRAIKTRFVPPELRESAGTLKHPVPDLVRREDIRGTFHVHTRYSDGVATVEQMLRAAKEAGFAYVGISDHSPLASYAGGLDEIRLAQQQAEIDEMKKKVRGLRVFKGTEADILANGEIDYGAKVWPRFDFMVASIHSRFKMDPDEMTDRMLRALENPFVTFLGHLTGRLLLSREGYGLHFDRVFEAAARNGVMIEINGDPHRLDIDWRRIGRALDAGVTFSIHPDAHSTSHYEYVTYGTWVARKGGVPKNRIFNTRDADEVSEYLAKRRDRAMGKGRKQDR